MRTRDLPPDRPQSANNQSGGAVHDAANTPRRSFLGGLLTAGAAGVGALLIIPVIRVVLHPVLAKTTEKSWSDVGKMDEFQGTSAPVQRLVQIESSNVK